MAFEVGSIFATIELDSKKFTEGVNKSIKDARNLKNKIEGQFKRVGSAIVDPLKKGAQKAGAAIAAPIQKGLRGAQSVVRRQSAKLEQGISEPIVAGATKARQALGSAFVVPPAIKREFGKLTGAIAKPAELGANRARNAITSGLTVPARFAKDLGKLRTGIEKPIVAGTNAARKAIRSALVVPEGGKQFQRLKDGITKPVVAGARAARETLAKALVVPPAAAAGFRKLREGISQPVKAGAAAVQRTLKSAFVIPSAAKKAFSGLTSVIADPVRRGAEQAGAALLRPFQRGATAAASVVDRRLVRPLKPLFSRIGRFAKEAGDKVGGIVPSQRISTALTRSLVPFTQRLGRIPFLAARAGAGMQSAFGGAANLLGGLGGSIGRIAPALGRLSAVLGPIGIALAAVTGAGIVGFRALRGAIGLLFAPLRLLSRTLFSLQGILAAFGTFKIIQIANQSNAVDSAFRNLTRSVGIASSTMLGKLRRALRGTVGDFELMLATNNSVLLGIVRNEEEFAELAGIARRLGKAVGRGPTEALADLSTGIARQSKLILDNLGIVLRLEAVYASYARTLGITAKELTDNEKRQAVLVGVLEEARKKVNALGEDVLGSGDQFRRLTAILGNVFGDIAVELVGKGSLFGAFADFLARNRKNIRVFANAIATSFKNLFAQVKRFFDRLSSGELSVGDVVNALIKELTTLLTIGLSALFEFVILLVANFIKRGPLIWIPIILGAVIEMFLLLQQEGAKLIVDLVGFLIKVAIQAFNSIADKLPGDIGKKLLGIVGLDTETLQGKVDEAVAAVQGKIDEGVDKLRPGSKALLSLGIGQVGKAVAETVRETKDAVGGTFVREMNKGTSALGKFVKGLVNLRALARENAKDPLFGFQPDKLNKVVQPFVNILESAAGSLRAQKEVLDPAKYTVFGNQILFVQEKLIQANTFLNKFTDNFFKKPIDPDAFATKFTEPITALTDELKKEVELNVTADTSDATEKLRQVQLLLEETERRTAKARLTPEQRVTLFTETSRARAAAIGLELKTVNEELRDVRIEIARIQQGDLAADLERIDENLISFLDQLGATDAQLSKLATTLDLNEDQLKELAEATGKSEEEFQSLIKTAKELKGETIELHLETNIDDIVARTEALQDQLANFGLTEAQIISRDAAKEIASIQADALLSDTQKADLTERLRAAVRDAFSAEEGLQFKSFTENTTKALVGGLAMGFVKGEKLSKSWAAATARVFEQFMDDTIDRLSKSVANLLSGVLGGGAGGVGVALIGLGAGILSRLASEKESTLDDIEDQITSSEAIRGVVAGPTNVALAKVGEQLKDALRTTELLLERIALGIEGRPGLGTSTTVDPAASLRLSGSTPT
jgi:hypothetical protein